MDDLTMNYRESHLVPGKGRSYHAAFSKNPYRSMVWRLERKILDRILFNLYENREIIHLDFACGTGRILSHLEGRALHSVGVDLSPSMLEVALQNNKAAEIIEADLTCDDVLADRKFNLITAFRFFPNAEPELRSQVLEVLVRHLTDDGALVFNNHKNVGSLRNRLARLFGRRNFTGMSIAETKKLLTDNNLVIVKTYHLCVFPASEKHKLIPVFLLRFIEELLSKILPVQPLGENLIYVCGRCKDRQ